MRLSLQHTTVQDKLSSTTYVCTYRFKFENLWFWQLISTYVSSWCGITPHTRTYVPSWTAKRFSTVVLDVCGVLSFFQSLGFDWTPSSLFCLLCSLRSAVLLPAASCCFFVLMLLSWYHSSLLQHYPIWQIMHQLHSHSTVSNIWQ